MVRGREGRLTVVLHRALLSRIYLRFSPCRNESVVVLSRAASHSHCVSLRRKRRRESDEGEEEKRRRVELV